MAKREPLWQDAIGICVGIGAILVALTRSLNLPYPPGDVRASPEFNTISTAILVGAGIFFIAVFTVRLIGGLRQR